MEARVRPYRHPVDYEAVGDFLIRTYRPGFTPNWPQARWEYMHYHPYLDPKTLEKIGVWEDESGSVVGVVHHEFYLGEVYFEVHPDYAWLKPVMLEYAEEHLYGTAETGERYVRAYINDFDGQFACAAEARGYVTMDRRRESVSWFTIPRPFPTVQAPDGFRIISLAEEDDPEKTNRLLWRGFNHLGEPPKTGDGLHTAEGRRLAQSAPNFRKDLNILAIAPNGDYASYCGMWYDTVNRMAYVEPVATDPDYRRRGLGTAVVLEGIQRCAELGATVAYVGTDKPFYLAMGFETAFTINAWVKTIG